MLAPEGRKILIPLMLLTFVFGIVGYGYEMGSLKILYYVTGVLFVFSLNFFRDPTRVTPEGDGLLISPADGKVVLIDDVEDDAVGSAKQIAGLIARRIHCYPKVGDSVAAGDRFGFIMFGSRTDLIVPSDSVVNVKVGDKVTGGKTVLGQLPNS